MKVPRLERLALFQRQHHRNHPWRLSQGGLHIRHAYFDMTPESLSYWDDVGFIRNGRRFIVWWQHPRKVYADALEKQAFDEVGDSPEDNWLFEGGTKNYKMVGKRKKYVGRTLRQPSAEMQAYYARVNQTIARLTNDGIDYEVPVSWKWQRLKWAMGISLVAPLEVRNEQELPRVADLAKKLISWNTKLSSEFPDYSYGRADWVKEHAQHAPKV